jgi:hypothetical protein
MGAGNYLPSRDVGDYAMIYVEADDYELLKEKILRCLPGSFYPDEKHRTRCYQIAENNLLSICVADNEWSTAVFVCPNDFVLDGRNEINLAYHHLPNIMKRIKAALGGYRLSVRNGPWCSSRI